MKSIIVTGSFDDFRSHHMRLLDEASKLGDLHVLLLSDMALRTLNGVSPKLTQEERLYLLQSIRYVKDVTIIDKPLEQEISLPNLSFQVHMWVVDNSSDTPSKRSYCQIHHIEYHPIDRNDLYTFSDPNYDPIDDTTGRKKVIVTGCFDWFHSGHVRFFEEVAELGDLYVVAGSDRNVRLLKGEGHPFFPQNIRWYMIQAVRFVKQAMISTGSGWMDAEPEVAVIKPDIYAVNEDGDKPDKRLFCQEHGIQYVVLKRLPKEGLPKRQSTDLRGF